MIDIKYNDDYSYSDIYMMDGLHSSIEIYTHDDSGKVIQLSNEQIHLESFEINQSICSGSDMVFGGCESAYCKFTVTSDFPSLVGKYIWIQSTLTNESIEPSRIDNYISLGSYRIVSDEWSANRVSRNITAYDKMYELQTINMYKWYESLTFPVSIGDMRKSAIDYIKLNDDTKDKTYCNDTVKISKVNGLSDLTAADVFRFISEMSGGFGIINTRGYFDIINLKNDPVYNYTSSYIKNMNYEDNKSEKIKMIYCDNEKSYTYITNTNENGIIYPIQNTKLLKNTDISTINILLRNINTAIKDIDYQKFNCDFRGNPCIEIGDKIAYQSEKDNFSGYLTERRIKGIHAITDTASCQQRYASRDLPDDEKKDEGVISSDTSVGGGGGINILDCHESDILENIPQDAQDGELYATREYKSDINEQGMIHSIANIRTYVTQHCHYDNSKNYTLDNLSSVGMSKEKIIMTPYVYDDFEREMHKSYIVDIPKYLEDMPGVTYYNSQKVLDNDFFDKSYDKTVTDVIYSMYSALAMKEVRVLGVGETEKIAERRNNPIISRLNLGKFTLEARIKYLTLIQSTDCSPEDSVLGSAATRLIPNTLGWHYFWTANTIGIEVEYYINGKKLTEYAYEPSETNPTPTGLAIGRNGYGGGTIISTAKEYFPVTNNSFYYYKIVGKVKNINSLPPTFGKYYNYYHLEGGSNMLFGWTVSESTEMTHYNYEGNHKFGNFDVYTFRFCWYDGYSFISLNPYGGQGDVSALSIGSDYTDNYLSYKPFDLSIKIRKEDLVDVEITTGPSNPDAGTEYYNTKEIVITKDWFSENETPGIIINQLNNFPNCEILRIGAEQIDAIGDRALAEMTNLKKVYFYNLKKEALSTARPPCDLLIDTNVDYIKYSDSFIVDDTFGGNLILANGLRSSELTLDIPSVSTLTVPVVSNCKNLTKLQLKLPKEVMFRPYCFAGLEPVEGIVTEVIFKTKIIPKEGSASAADSFPTFMLSGKSEQLLLKFPAVCTEMENWCRQSGVKFQTITYN